MLFYYVCFVKDFHNQIWLEASEIAFVLFAFNNKEDAIQRAEYLKRDLTINRNVEFFAVFESTSKKWNSEKNKLCWNSREGLINVKK
jgi:hypothetical protein